MPIKQRGMRALLIWCQRACANYPGVHVTDLGASFRDGLAFCAIIHRYRPDLIEFDGLRAADVFENNDLAFRVAEDKLDIPSLLDPQDMVDCDEPDKFSIVTYVSQFYHLFKDETASPNLSLNRSSESENDSLLQSSAESTPLGTPKAAKKSPPAKKVFNQAELIAKYGEEIFSDCSPPSKKAPEKPRPETGIKSLCDGMVSKARLSFEGGRN